MKQSLKFSKKALLTMALLGSTALFCVATPVKAEELTEGQKKEIEELFKQLVEKHPGLIADSVTNYYREQDQKAKENAQGKVKEYSDFYKQTNLPVAGNPDGDVTVVEYFDYNCGYCKKAFQDISKLLEEDKNIRVVFQEMPILSPSSKNMATIAMAAHKQGKYFEMHTALMNYRGPQTIEAFMGLAGKQGLDVEQLKKDIGSGDIDQAILKSMEMARSVGITGTPGFVIGERIYPGYIGLDGLKKAIQEVRSAE